MPHHVRRDATGVDEGEFALSKLDQAACMAADILTTPSPSNTRSRGDVLAYADRGWGRPGRPMPGLRRRDAATRPTRSPTTVRRVRECDAFAYNTDRATSSPRSWATLCAARPRKGGRRCLAIGGPRRPSDRVFMLPVPGRAPGRRSTCGAQTQGLIRGLLEDARGPEKPTFLSRGDVKVAWKPWRDAAGRTWPSIPRSCVAWRKWWCTGRCPRARKRRTGPQVGGSR